MCEEIVWGRDGHPKAICSTARNWLAKITLVKKLTNELGPAMEMICIQVSQCGRSAALDGAEFAY